MWTRSKVPVLVQVLLLLGAAPAVADEPDLDAGLQSYQRYCQSCHGAWGRGDGKLAKYLKVPPADLTRLSENNDGAFPAERLVLVIDGREEVRTHGSREMPIWGRVLAEASESQDPEAAVRDQIDQLLDVLRWFDEEAPGPASGR